MCVTVQLCKQIELNVNNKRCRMVDSSAWDKCAVAWDLQRKHRQYSFYLGRHSRYGTVDAGISKNNYLL